MMPELPQRNEIRSRPLCRGRTDSNQNRSALLSEIKTPIKTEPFSDQYSLIPGKELGRGKFAVVKKCVERRTGKEFAAKFLRKRRKGQDCRLEIIHEMAVLELATASPRVVSLHQVYETASEMILVLEYAAGGEIFQQCVAERDEAFKEGDVKRLMRQILEGVAFLHSHSVVHLDLKPQNILLTSAAPVGDVKIVDFGLSRVVSGGRELREIMGTPEYVAPEILNYEPISTATDMWSIGVLAYVMLTGASPFLGDDKQETFLNISQINVSYAEEELDGLGEPPINFIKSLLLKDPRARATAQDCLNHPWLLPQDGEILRNPRPPLQEEEEEDEEGLETEELIVVASYTLGPCRQSDQQGLAVDQKAVSKRFKFEASFGPLQEIIF
ncbi:serine/threonine-protein kinase 17A-like [Conger conger]|uniref:serine/threonine-protein kinase 17A-like n=1 Tax=Conger conger TaxID=82655 RepID=UPI002A5AE224|nr:serine/threonine-protein kinase 17A-like [Conger conger]